MIDYEQQDYDTAKEIITKGFLMNLNKQTLELTDDNIVDVAKKYYVLRLRTFNPQTGNHI